MNFAWAMDMVLNQERAVRREGWKNKDYILTDGVAIRYILFQTQRHEVFTPNMSDMMSEDWVEVLEV